MMIDKVRIRARAWMLCGASLAAMAGTANAQREPQSSVAPVATQADVQEITVIGRAQPLSPSIAPLDVTQPTSRVAPEFLQNNIIPLASVDDIIKYQPSVWTQNPNGPGIGKAQTITLRGFNDSSGQFNMTFDGIPFGDATDLHHTTSAIFIAHDLGGAEVDRGPGTASTIGKATFGGTIGFLSKAPSTDPGLDAYGTFGSFNTVAGGLEYDTGATNYGSGFIDGQHEQTDGYQTGSYEYRTNLALRYDVDLAPKTSLTIVSSYNEEFQFTTQGATLAEYKQFGDAYGLCSNPALQCDYDYQPSHYYSSFSYARLKTEIAGLKIDNTLYNDSFEHDYAESKDASDDNALDNTVTQYNPITLKKVSTLADIPGKRADAQWDAFGDILRFAYDTPFGQLRTGVWVEQQDDHRYSYNTDITKNVVDIGKTGTDYSYTYKDTGVTWEPYLEFEWKPLANLSIIPGVRYTSYARTIDALINKTTGAPLNTTDTYEAPLPSIAANWRIEPTWSAYAQIAKGYLAPPISVAQVTVINTGLKAEETTNYQLGTTWKSHSATLSADVYYIDFDNFLTSTQIPGTTETTYINSGGVIYQGAEFEGQYALTHGLSLYANYSYNSAKYKGTNVVLAEVPEWIAAAGVLYDDRRGPYFSLIGKFVGPRFGDDGTVIGAPTLGDIASTRIKTDFTADLAVGYHFRQPPPYAKLATISLKVANILNNRQIDDFAGYQSVGSAELFWRNAGISAFVNLDAKF